MFSKYAADALLAENSRKGQSSLQQKRLDSVIETEMGFQTKMWYRYQNKTLLGLCFERPNQGGF